MTTFGAALRALNLSHGDAADLLKIKYAMVADMVRGKTRVPAGIWRELGDLLDQIETAADEIIADQGEIDAGEGLVQLTLMVATIPLAHAGLRAAAAARAMLVIGPDLLDIVEERERVE